VATLADHILDLTDLAATSLDDRLKARCLAVIVLAHAEIEETLEKACEEVVDALETFGPPDFHFLAWGLSSTDSTQPKENDYKKQLSAGSTVTYLAQKYRALIKATNGIKRKNMGKLLLPIGIDLIPLKTDIDNLNGFGEKRGEAAHLSPLKAQLVNAPSTVKANVVSAAQSADVVLSAIYAVRQAIIAKTPPARVRPPFIRRLIEAFR
jgi:hypothetical protein